MSLTYEDKIAWQNKYTTKYETTKDSVDVYNNLA